jgi:hypothetical protein
MEKELPLFLLCLKKGLAMVTGLSRICQTWEGFLNQFTYRMPICIPGVQMSKFNWGSDE